MTCRGNRTALTLATILFALIFDARGLAFQSPARSSDELRKALASAQGSVRRQAVLDVGELRKAELLPSLLPLLKDADADIRVQVTVALAKNGQNAHFASEALLEAAQDADANVRAGALAALGMVHATSPEAMALYAKGLDDPSPLARHAAILSLAQAGSAAQPLLPKLRVIAKQTDQVELAAAACFTLGHLGLEQEPTAAVLRPLLESNNSITKVEAAAALWKLTQDDKCLDALDVESRNRNPQIKAAAFERFTDVFLREADADATKALRMLDKRSIVLKRAMIAALIDLPTEKLRTIRVELMGLLHDGALRQYAYPILCKLGAELLPELRTNLKSDNEIARREAAEVLGRMGTVALPALPDLCEALKDRDYSVRQAAARAIGQFGADGKPALPALKEAANDKHNLVRTNASRAIDIIEGREPIPDPNARPPRER